MLSLIRLAALLKSKLSSECSCPRQTPHTPYTSSWPFWRGVNICIQARLLSAGHSEGVQAFLKSWCDAHPEAVHSGKGGWGGCCQSVQIPFTLTSQMSLLTGASVWTWKRARLHWAFSCTAELATEQCPSREFNWLSMHCLAKIQEILRIVEGTPPPLVPKGQGLEETCTDDAAENKGCPQ